MELVQLFSYGAALCMIGGYVPQAVKTIRSRRTDDIALPTFIMLGLGSAFFVVLGLMTDVWAVWVANLITLVCSVIIFGIKMYNDYFSPAAKERKSPKRH